MVNWKLNALFSGHSLCVHFLRKKWNQPLLRLCIWNVCNSSKYNRCMIVHMKLVFKKQLVYDMFNWYTKQCSKADNRIQTSFIGLIFGRWEILMCIVVLILFLTIFVDHFLAAHHRIREPVSYVLWCCERLNSTVENSIKKILVQLINKFNRN